MMISFEELIKRKESICIIGLGYVGFPLLKVLAKKYNVIGFDINVDVINRISKSNIEYGKKYIVSNNPDVISLCKVCIVTVPTPTVNGTHTPDYSYLENASKIISQHMKKGTLIIYESTVGPGTIIERCLPILESLSNMKCEKDFLLGYSPERINPGDKINKVENITKLVAGTDKKTTLLMKKIYDAVLKVPTYPVSNIKIAEISKLFENIQRDINIALMNEFSEIMNSMNIDFSEVLDAAKTKWNFLNFSPGLVGGHCIGVDINYFLDYLNRHNINSKIINTAREINESHPNFIYHKILESIYKYNCKSICILGISYKENVSDTRNSKALDITKKLLSVPDLNIDVFDPLQIDNTQIDKEKYILKDNEFDSNNYDCILILVGHDVFEEYINIEKKIKPIIFDLTGKFKKYSNKNAPYIKIL